MTLLRVAAVDDEPVALDRLAELLAQITGVELVATFRNGRDLVASMNTLDADLLLLDIEMPRLDGFDVVEALHRRRSEQSNVPLICFVTAYPNFASTAFDTGAIDFLCKPVRLARLDKAIERAKEALKQRQAARRLEELSRQLDSLRESKSPRPDQSIWVQQRGGALRIEISEIDWIGAEGEYVRLHAGGRSFLARNTITRMAEEFEPFGFLRIHRSAIVNADRVETVRSSRSGTKVVLRSGTELSVGRRFRQPVNALTGREIGAGGESGRP